MDPKGVYCRVLEELENIIAELLELWESVEVFSDWQLANFIHDNKNGMKKGPGNNRPVCLGKIVEKIVLGDI